MHKHWSKTTSPEISCQKKQALMYTGTNSREGEESAQRKSAQKICKILRRRSVMIPLIRFLGRPCETGRQSCPLLILMGKKSEKPRTPSEIFFYWRERKPSRSPSIHTNGQEATKTFQRKIFHTGTTAGSRRQTRPPAIPSSFTTSNFHQEEPALRHEKLVRKPRVRSRSDLDSKE